MVGAVLRECRFVNDELIRVSVIRVYLGIAYGFHRPRLTAPAG